MRLGGGLASRGLGQLVGCHNPASRVYLCCKFLSALEQPRPTLECRHRSPPFYDDDPLATYRKILKVRRLPEGRHVCCTLGTVAAAASAAAGNWSCPHPVVPQGTVTFPSHFSVTARDLIRKLLQVGAAALRATSCESTCAAACLLLLSAPQQHTCWSRLHPPAALCQINTG